jgi:hypothetical protein
LGQTAIFGSQVEVFSWRYGGMSKDQALRTKEFPTPKAFEANLKGRESTFWWDGKAGFGGMRGIPRRFCKFRWEVLGAVRRFKV